MPGCSALEGQAVVEVGEGGLGGTGRLLPRLLLLLHLLHDGGKHCWKGDCSFVRVLGVSFGALGFAWKRSLRSWWRRRRRRRQEEDVAAVVTVEVRAGCD